MYRLEGGLLSCLWNPNAWRLSRVFGFHSHRCGLRRLRRSLARTVGAFLALFLITATAAMALPREKQRWVELDTPGFKFFSNAGQRATARIATDLENLRAVLGQLSTLEMSSPVPTTIYIFKSDASFRPYKILHEGKPAAVSGYFAAREHANFIAINGGSGWDASDIIYHEYVHYVLDNNFSGLPVWFGEGLAEFYSTFQIAGDQARIGRPSREHIFWLRDNPLIPLDQLFAVDHESPIYNERERKGAFYAQSWALVHYLLVGSEQRREQGLRFLKLLDHLPQDAAFDEAFAADYATLERELRSYVGGRRFHFLAAPTEKLVEVAIELRPMARPDVLYRLGELLANHWPARHGEAAEHFRAALAAKPDHGPARAGLGYLAEQQERWDEARDFYARAAELAPEDPLIQYRYGAALLQLGGEVDAGQAVAALRRSVELDPGFAPAWAGLVYASTLDAEPPGESVLRTAEAAHRLLPSRVDVAFNLFVLYARAGRRDAAQRLFDGYLSARARSADLDRARAQLVRMDVERAGKLLAEGDLDAAAELVERLAARTVGGGDQADVDAQIRLLRRAIEDRRFGARFKEALDRLNAGEPEAAVTLLEQLSAQGLEDRHGKRVRAVLEQIREERERTAAREARARQARRRADADAAQRADQERVAGLLARGRPAEALEVLERMNRRPSSVNLRRWIGITMEQARGLIEHQHFIERYNEAVDWFNAREYAAAVKVLAQLIATMPEDRAVDDARALLEEAKAAMKRQS